MNITNAVVEIDQNTIDAYVKFGFVVPNGEQGYTITADGKRAQHLPLNIPAAAAFCEAVRAKLLGEMIPLIALIELGDIRFNLREPLKYSRETTSDAIDQICLLAELYQQKEPTKNNQSANIIGRTYNLNMVKYNTFKALVTELEKLTAVDAVWSFYTSNKTPEEMLDFERKCKQIIFAAHFDRTYPVDNELHLVLIPEVAINDRKFVSAQKVRTSRIMFEADTRMVSGYLKKIAPKDKVAFPVIEWLTVYSAEDIDYLISVFGKDRLETISEIGNHRTELSYQLNPELRERTSSFNKRVDRAYGNKRPRRQGGQGPRSNDRVPTTGTFGLLLQKAMTEHK